MMVTERQAEACLHVQICIWVWDDAKGVCAVSQFVELDILSQIHIMGTWSPKSESF